MSKKKQNFGCLSNCRYCADRTKICQSQPPTMYSECSRFHLNRFTFGGVISARVNTVKSPGKVNPIFGRRLASSRITSDTIQLVGDWRNDTDLGLEDEIFIVTCTIVKTLSEAEDGDRTELGSFTMNNKTDIRRQTLHYQSAIYR